MDITPRIAATAQIIQAYGNGGFKIAGAAYSGSVIVLPEMILEWEVQHAEGLTQDALRALAEQLPPSTELLLLGCGVRMTVPSPAWRRILRDEYRIALDAMDTGAACRTFNVLLSEGRNVAAALVAV